MARLEAARWPAGPVCPACGAGGASVMRAGNTSRRRGVLKCNRCRLRFTVTTGTPLAHSHIPLDQWLRAIDLYRAGRPRGKAAQISQALNVTYKTAWSMVRRISAMQGSHTWLTREVGTQGLRPTSSEPGGNGHLDDPRSSASRAKVAILDAAERIISSHGLTALSIRSVAKEANVAHASISYYFGPKASLLREVFRRRREPVLAESVSLLDACIEEAPDGTPSVEALIRALLTPSTRLYANVDSARAVIIANFLVRTFSTSTEARELQREYQAVRTRFVDALCRAAPHLKRTDVVWRYHMLLGCLYYTAAVRSGPLSPRRRARSPKARAAQAEEWINQIVSFAARGFGVATAKSELP